MMSSEPNNTSILIIDDDRELTEMLTEYLRLDGFDVTSVHRGDDGAKQALAGHFDAVVLDVMLPGINGFDALKQIRQHSLVPIIMLTAKGDDIDRILGLEMGADDYLPKPFNPRELVARLKAIIRRQKGTGSRDGENIQCRNLILSPRARKAEINGQPLELTSTEYTVLELLARHAGAVVSKESLYEGAIGRSMSPYDRSLDMHISHLRRKLASLDDRLVIHTVRGTGYQLEK